MKPKRAIRVLIFDVDLTICWNLERKRKAVERALGRQIGEAEWEKIKYVYGFEEILARLGVRAEVKDFTEKVLNHFLHDLDLFELDSPMEGAVETLRALAAEGYRIYYLTGRPVRQTAVNFLSKFGFPPGRILSVGVRRGESMKKAALFREILEDAGVGPAEALAVGDMPGDAEAAKAVGIATVCTLEGRAFDRSELAGVCDHIIGKITDLPALIKRLEAGSRVNVEGSPR